MTNNYNFMKIKEIPWFDRPWTKLKNKGVSALGYDELLAIVLGRGNGQENAIDLLNIQMMYIGVIFSI